LRKRKVGRLISYDIMEICTTPFFLRIYLRKEGLKKER